MTKRTRRIDQRIFSDFGGQRVIDGETIETYLSPFDAPRSIQYDRDEDEKILRVEFTYIDNEKTSVMCKHGAAKIGIGKYSGRIMSISLYLETEETAEGAAKIADELTRVIEEHRVHGKTPQMNMDATRTAIEESPGSFFG